MDCDIDFVVFIVIVSLSQLISAVPLPYCDIVVLQLPYCHHVVTAIHFVMIGTLQILLLLSFNCHFR